MNDARSPVVSALAALGELDLALSDTQAVVLGRVAAVEAVLATLLKGRRDLDDLCDAADRRLASRWAKDRPASPGDPRHAGFVDRIYGAAREQIDGLRKS